MFDPTLDNKLGQRATAEDWPKTEFVNTTELIRSLGETGA